MLLLFINLRDGLLNRIGSFGWYRGCTHQMTRWPKSNIFHIKLTSVSVNSSPSSILGIVILPCDTL